MAIHNPLTLFAHPWLRFPCLSFGPSQKGVGLSDVPFPGLLLCIVLKTRVKPSFAP